MQLTTLRAVRRTAVNGTGSWYKIANQSSGATRVDIYDEIGFWGVMAQDFVTELGRVRGDLEVHINSPGGDVFDGVAIYNAMIQHKGDVAVYIDGLAASAASFIAQAARPGKLLIAKTATMMIHNGFGLVVGDANDMRKMADVLDDQTANIASIYADRTGKPIAHWSALMNEESWFIGQKAVDQGLADGLIGDDGHQPASVSADWDLSVFRNTPTQLLPRNNAQQGEGVDGHGAHSGRHSHTHPAFDGAGNVHEHDHEHSGHANHHHDHGNEYATGDGTSNAATPVYVGSTQTRHMPTTTTHTHDHGAFGHPDHDDGVHSHEHSHAGEASHDHGHESETSAGEPGRTAYDTLADEMAALLPAWMQPRDSKNDAAREDGATDGEPAAGTWSEAATRVGTEMASLLRGNHVVADAPQGGE